MSGRRVLPFWLLTVELVLHLALVVVLFGIAFLGWK